MLNFIKLLVLLININQETVLNWFGIRATDSLNKNLDLSNGKVESTSGLSISTFQLIFKEVWQQIQDGLTLTDIENILFFIIFVRFLILAIQYNLIKTEEFEKVSKNNINLIYLKNK